MSLPNPGMSYSPFDPLPASDLNDMVENIESLADGTGIDDGSITFAKTTGIWWEELGRTTLGSAGDTIPVAVANRKYLKIIVHILSTGGTTEVAFRFNGDTGSNYTTRFSTNGGADASSGSTSSAEITSATSGNKHSVIDCLNIASQEKILYGSTVSNNAAGAGNAADRWEGVGKWANTSNAITTVTVQNAGSATGDFNTGSQVVVLGHD